MTVRELFGHRAGLIGVDGGFGPAELADDRIIAERLAEQRPFWARGAGYGDHAPVIGALPTELEPRFHPLGPPVTTRAPTRPAWPASR